MSVVVRRPRCRLRWLWLFEGLVGLVRVEVGSLLLLFWRRVRLMVRVRCGRLEGPLY